ncbi:MAG: acyl-CoA synthetase [Mycobacterium kyogaense]
MDPSIHAREAPHRPAVVMAGTGRVLTYRELDERSAGLAAALHKVGVRDGDVIALVTDNRAEAFEVYWAAVRSGLYVTFVNRHLAPDEAAYIVSDSAAKVVFASANVAGLAAALAARVDGVEHWYCIGGDIDGYRSYDDLVAGQGERLTSQRRGVEMLYSSGTTGRPKGIKPLRAPATTDDAADPFVTLLEHGFAVGPDDVYLSPAPIYHAAPLKWCAAVHALGGTVVLMERFDADDALAAIERFRVTVAQLVPTMFVRMLQLSAAARTAYDVSSLRLAVHAGAPCPPEVKDRMIRWWGPILVEYYSATEQHGTTLITTEEWQRKRGSVGRAVIGTLHICDDDGDELPPGDVGTVYFERDAAPFEYHGDPDKTASSRHPRHRSWCTVGDLGYTDDDGYLYLTDRKAFMIISGGVNIYPQEIENTLALHPAVHDVAVIGVPNAEMGEEVKAVVQLRDHVMPSPEVADDIIRHVRDSIAHYKVPRTVDFVDQLPRSATGKLVKRTLVEHYAKGEGHA